MPTQGQDDNIDDNMHIRKLRNEEDATSQALIQIQQRDLFTFRRRRDHPKAPGHFQPLGWFQVRLDMFSSACKGEQEDRPS